MRFLPRLPLQPQTSWSNWAGNQKCHPTRVERPLSEKHLQEIVQRAARGGSRVRAVGSGHSFTAIACTDEVLVSLEHQHLVHHIDRDKMTVTADAGIELTQLNSQIAKAGLAMTNLGDIAYQSLAGAVSTSTHGTGLRFGGLATQIRGLRILTASGDFVDCSADENAELFHAARVSLGAFGIITQVTLQLEPAFNLHAIEEPRPVDEVLSSWREDIAACDHYEFFWIPGTDQAMTKRNRRTTDAAQPLSATQMVRDKILGENLGFGAMCKMAARRPSLIPKFRDTIASSVSRQEYTDTSHKVFTSRRWVKFVEMEYSVPVADVPAVVRKIDAAVRDAGLDLLFPIEARVVAADDIPLSTSTGRDSGYVAVHRMKGLPFRPYFELVEAIVADHEGRPHWGKMHFQTASSLRGLYPEWERFAAVRAEHDPTGMFTNDYIDRVLGPAG